ncbi:MAG TPA: hypothetical protein VLE69_01580 [Candidatus Saccharimonadales bacterium]|nr:hypothetical protein [Candidatus Saccharimonadales bacterium]
MFATTILGVTLSAIWWFMIAVLWVIIAFWPAMIAKGKGYSFLLFFILSLPFWWIMLFVALFMPDKSGPSSTPVAPAE